MQASSIAGCDYVAACSAKYDNGTSDTEDSYAGMGRFVDGLVKTKATGFLAGGPYSHGLDTDLSDGDAWPNFTARMQEIISYLAERHVEVPAKIMDFNNYGNNAEL